MPHFANDQFSQPTVHQNPEYIHEQEIGRKAFSDVFKPAQYLDSIEDDERRVFMEWFSESQLFCEFIELSFR